MSTRSGHIADSSPTHTRHSDRILVGSTSGVVCRDFQRGSCRFGSHCKFVHRQVADPVSSNRNVRTVTSGPRILDTMANAERPSPTTPRVRAMPSSSSPEQQGNEDKGVPQGFRLKRGMAPGVESVAPVVPDPAEETQEEFRKAILQYATQMEKKMHRGVSLQACSLGLLVRHIKRCPDISPALKSLLHSRIDNISLEPCSVTYQHKCHLDEEAALQHYSKFIDEALSMLEEEEALEDLRASIKKVKDKSAVAPSVAPSTRCFEASVNSVASTLQPRRRRASKIKAAEEENLSAEEEEYFSADEIFEDESMILRLKLLHLQQLAKYVVSMAALMYEYVSLNLAHVNPLLKQLEKIKNELKEALNNL